MGQNIWQSLIRGESIPEKIGPAKFRILLCCHDKFPEAAELAGKEKPKPGLNAYLSKIKYTIFCKPVNNHTDAAF